ncbi:MAG: hypothetical protein ACK5JF_11980 [Oscillospiraceae bacterium]
MVQIKKIAAVVISLLMLAVIVSGCSTEFNFKDGTYTAEFADYDSSGYKEYIVVTVEEGIVTRMEYDAKNANGDLRSADEQYKADMEALEGTSPNQYVQDLINQYMEKHDITKVDVVAGATYATENFVALFIALEPSMSSGDTAAVVVSNFNP